MSEIKRQQPEKKKNAPLSKPESIKKTQEGIIYFRPAVYIEWGYKTTQKIWISYAA